MSLKNITYLYQKYIYLFQYNLLNIQLFFLNYNCFFKKTIFTFNLKSCFFKIFFFLIYNNFLINQKQKIIIIFLYYIQEKKKKLFFSKKISAKLDLYLNINQVFIFKRYLLCKNYKLFVELYNIFFSSFYYNQCVLSNKLKNNEIYNENNINFRILDKNSFFFSFMFFNKYIFIKKHKIFLFSTRILRHYKYPLKYYFFLNNKTIIPLSKKKRIKNLLKFSFIKSFYKRLYKKSHLYNRRYKKKMLRYRNLNQKNKPHMFQTRSNFFLNYSNSRNIFIFKHIPQLTINPYDRRKRLFKHKLRFFQQLKFFFGCISKKQLDKFLKKSIHPLFYKTKNINIFKYLIAQLETRLDIILLRTGVVKTIFQAKQYINHGFIKVNNIFIRKPSYNLKKGDIFEYVAKRKIRKTVSLIKQNFFLKKNYYDDRFNSYSINIYNILKKKNLWSEKKKNKKFLYSHLFLRNKLLPIELISKKSLNFILKKKAKKRRKIQKKMIYFQKPLKFRKKLKKKNLYTNTKKQSKKKFQIKTSMNIRKKFRRKKKKKKCFNRNKITLYFLDSKRIHKRFNSYLRYMYYNLKISQYHFKNILKKRSYIFNEREFLSKKKIPTYITYNIRLKKGVFLRNPFFNEIEYPFRFNRYFFENYIYKL